MSESKEIKSSESKEMETRRESEVVLRPAADIYENAQGITLTADLPGVSRDRLNIQVEGDTLEIEGVLSLEMPEGMEALHADVRATRYRRAFVLSKELDADNISAQLKEGVLTLHVPKRAEAVPRKIEVSVG